VFRRRQRYVFRKRSIRERTLGPAIGLLIVVAGLVLFVPWLTLSSADEEAPKVEDSKDQTEQPSTEDQPEQEPETNRLEDEIARDVAPSEEGGASNESLPPSPFQPLPPPPVQAPSLPPTPPPSLPSMEVPTDFFPPSDYWDYYYEPSY
jgi:hypothetical protein